MAAQGPEFYHLKVFFFIEPGLKKKKKTLHTTAVPTVIVSKLISASWSYLDTHEMPQSKSPAGAGNLCGHCVNFRHVETGPCSADQIGLDQDGE